MTQTGPLATRSTDKADPARPRRRLLVVGAARPALCLGQDADALVVHTRLAHLTADLLDTLRPDTVLAPLFAGGWDILDLAEVLQSTGYRGPVMVQSGPLPRADLVMAEIRGLFPDLALALVETSG